ncbi:MAG: glycosyltransferase [Anaerovibrio sp.]|uniref:glycosyltransferase n=1 Tax=Anaerovibrio sp. TaxID=1872532 RepID=UPI001B098276|nr:glycosyltransferase [Anaerovibrio sp.]MBO5589335.1 glycosyltransferase [Anaerovibrio sp.]MBO6246645.1 glycosyltransferase [Anaerovibrio sp.]
MRIAIFENIMTPGGHEVDFNRIIVEEMQKCGNEICFYVPEGFKFSMDYHVPVHELKGEVVSYSGITGLRKLLASVKREINRVSWFKQLYEAGKRGDIDAIIIPTSTYRYLRTISKSVFRHSPIPVIFILHGINSGEVPKFLKEAKKLEACANIRPTVLTFTDNIFGEKRPNIRTIYPPTFIPRDIEVKPIQKDEGTADSQRPLIIGFFGQYRREKRLEDFLEVYFQGHYTRPVKLLVQGATMHPEDSEDFERIIKKYSNRKGIQFLHKGLIGAEWQQAIMDIDALLLPYSAPRYKYHWGGMLFTAIGFKKPVVTSDDMNPEVFEAYNIGEVFESGNMAALKASLEHFINTYDEMKDTYETELQKAYDEYSPEAFAQRIEKIIKD